MTTTSQSDSSVPGREIVRWAMRRLVPVAAFLLFASPVSFAGAAVEGVHAAVFDLDFVDTSQEGASGHIRDDEARRLAMVSDTLRRMLAERGIAVVDLAPARERIGKAAPLSRCN